MAAVLVKSDILVNSFAKNVSQSIVNKVGDYFAAGKPVLNTLENEEFCRLIEKYHAGLNVEAENPEALCDGILEILSDPRQYSRMCASSRRLAERRFSRKNSYQEIVKLAESLQERMEKHWKTGR